MAKATWGSIVIKAADEDAGVIRDEYLAGAANITPGELLVISAANTVVQHAAAAGELTGKLVALESQTPDSETVDSIDLDYDNGDTVYCALGRPGDVFYMWLAAGETAAISSYLQSDGAGALAVVIPAAGTLTNSVVGFTETAVDNGAGIVAVRIKVEII